MKGLCKVAEGPGHVELREVNLRDIGPDEVLIRVKAAGICGSDIHIYNWHTQVTMNPPVVMGHEFSGIIETVGSNAAGWGPGDRVTAEPSYYVCGRCRFCMTGRYNLCHERRVLGFWTDGAFAEYVIVPAHRLHRLPDNISFEEGALTEPFACGVHGVHELLKIRSCETAVVSGPGAIGILAAQVAKAAGATVIMIGTEVDRNRLRIARELGFDHVLDLSETDPETFVMDMTGGLGADVAIECSGAAPAVNMDLKLVRKAGRYLQLGLFGEPIQVDFESIAYKEIEVYGSFAQKWTAWKTSLQMMENGSVDLKAVVSDILPLEDWQKGFDKLNAKEGMKILLQPGS